MKDLNGETMLLRNHLGFWREMTDRKMPDTRFLEQEDVAFEELGAENCCNCTSSQVPGCPPTSEEILHFLEQS